MSTALATVTEAPIVTADQVALIKQTVASGATDAELKLYLFDCARQGVHPLDRLIHFTKRGGKYTPVTSIDFMRTRAADTGEMAGSDEAVFSTYFADAEEKYPEYASVTVYRLTQGQRFAYAGTAYWSEYCPAAGQDHMWRKMPHTMLAKCAEALALRKGFPRQLAGLYAKEELDQADSARGGYVVEAPKQLQAPANAGPESARRGDAQPTASQPPVGVAPSQSGDSGQLPDGAVYIERIDATPTKNKNVTKYLVTLSTGETASTIKGALAAQCEQWCQDGVPVIVETTQSKWGHDLVSVHTVKPAEPDDDLGSPVMESDIPF